MRRWIALPSMLLALAASPVARAQSDVAAAEALFEAGRAAMEKGDFASACPRFGESERLDPAPGTLLNLADCEEHLGHLARAWEAWKEALATLPASDARLPAAKKRERAIESRVPRLTLTRAPGAPGETIARRDNVEIHAASFDVPLPVDPGDHTIVVSAPGREAKTTVVTMKEGETRTLPVEPGPALPLSSTTPPSSTQSPSASTPTPTSTQTSTSTPTSTPFPWRPLGFITGAVGLAGIGVGSAFGIAAIGDKSTVDANCFGTKGCKQPGADAASAGRTNAILSDVGFAAGGTLLAVGVLLVLTHPARKAGLVLPAPVVLARGAGVALEGEF
jgi:hypothetical protein